MTFAELANAVSLWTPLSTPELHLQTSYVLDANGRITSTREPGAVRGPLFCLVRSLTACAWAIRADVAEGVASEIDDLVKKERPVTNLKDPPFQARRYEELFADRALRRDSGPAFTFPELSSVDDDVVVIDDERLLEHEFRGWVPGEIAAGRAPVMAILADQQPVSVCFSARLSNVAAEAGVETAAAFRGRGFAPRVASAWAAAIFKTGRLPLYSTSWTNEASLAVARKIGLVAYACRWTLWGDDA